MSGIYIYGHAIMGSPAHFVPRHQSLILLPLEHLLCPVYPPGCQVP